MLKSLINLLFPKTCCGCNGILLESEITLCITCRHEMPFTLHHLTPENETAKKFYGRLPLEHASSMVYFHKQGIVQELIHNLKYRGRQEAGLLMGQWYAPDLANVAELESVDEIIPVPLHSRKLRERGYNQVEAFGRALAAGINKSYNGSLLQRKTYSRSQTKKNLQGRAEIIESAFVAHHSSGDHGKHFLLIDDVITTGATLEACGRALLAIPGAKLSIVTIAYAHT